ncbi:MAG: L-arabinose isomerase [Clostridiales bacterium]|nr:L-arabinose isomerase [Clostridiales bacterium]
MDLSAYKFWFVVGSQTLYGQDVLDTIDRRGQEMAEKMSQSPLLPWPVIYKATAKSDDEILALVKQANQDDSCAGLITWMHTFSPSKMWIKGLVSLEKPYCHLATQYNREIPYKEIDMDFMNLNQAAHGDREHGFITSRLRAGRKIIAGYWQDPDILAKLGQWMRAAVGAAFSKNLKLVRFGDNMRHVAVTEGDKVEAQIKFGWQVNTWPVGDLVAKFNQVPDEEVDKLIKDYKNKYEVNTENTDAVRYQAKIQLAIEKMLLDEGAVAFTNTFEDLHGMEQLPGLATQDLSAKGYGYGGEGDWKVAALTAIMKAMATGLEGGTGFMEDYTYDLTKGDEISLGAHMLEVCPSFAKDKPKIQVHELGIGGKNPPARLVFEGKAGPAIVVSLVDMGGRFRLICQDIQCLDPVSDMPNLPVARIMWKAMPDLLTGLEAWLLAGGAHHTVLSYALTAGQMEDLAEIWGVEFVHISKDTDLRDLKDRLFLMDLAWKLGR